MPAFGKRSAQARSWKPGRRRQPSGARERWKPEGGETRAARLDAQHDSATAARRDARMLGTELIAVRLALQPRPLGRLLQPFPQHRTWRQAGQVLGDMDRLADAFRTNREDGDISPARLRCDVHCLCRRAFIRPGNQRSLLDRRGRPSTGNVQEAAMPATIQMILPARIPMIGKLQNNELGVGRHHHRRHQGRDATRAAKDRVSNAESVTTLISPFFRRRSSDS